MTLILVRGGTVVDGTGAPAVRADVRVRDGLIVEIGPHLLPDGEAEVDASGDFVTPGFIDIHTHLDPTLFWDPYADPMPQHGVTTVIAGNCSLSLAPLRAEYRESLADLFCYIEDMPRRTFAEGIPWDWETYEEFAKSLGREGLGINMAGLIGLTPLRLFAMGEDAWDRAATGSERAAIAKALDFSLQAGAFGLSVSLLDEDERGRPVPSRLADGDELQELSGVLAAHRSVLQLLPDTHGLEPERDVERFVALIGNGDVALTWLGLAQSERTAERNERMLASATHHQRRGRKAYPQMSPRTVDITVNWERSMAFMTLPQGWHRLIQVPLAEKPSLLADPEWRQTARREWDRVEASIFPHRHPDKVRIITASKEALREWRGKTLADLVAARGGHPSDVLADWLLDNELRTGIVAVGILNDDPAEVAQLITHPAAIIGASDAGAHVGMMCAAGDSTLLLTRHVRERGDLTLERAVYELTGRPAAIFGIPERGTIQVGAVADLAVFDLEGLRWDGEVFVDDLPGGGSRLRRPPGGYRFTIVGGVVVQREGQLLGSRPGGVLSRQAPTS